MKFTYEEAALASEHRIGLDIGGTLAKLAYVVCTSPGSPTPTSTEGASDEALIENTKPIKYTYDDKSYSICFKWFPTSQPDALIDFLKTLSLGSKSSLRVTGGGAHRFHDRLSRALNVRIIKCDEMHSVVRGMTLVATARGEALFYDLAKKKKVMREPADEIKTFPCLLVSIGSGVSILKVTGKDSFERVSGTCIGGGTVLGLAKLCFGAESFEEVVDLSERGSDKLDLKVKHLRGDTAGSSTLPPDTLASSFGRLYTDQFLSTQDSEITPADISRSAIQMVSYNIGYLALLVAKVHGLNRIFFGGKYINNHSFTMRTITQAVTFYSNYYKEPQYSGYDLVSSSEWEDPYSNRNDFEQSVAFLQRSNRRRPQEHCVEALFLRHDGYLGALGALLHP
eukprot:Blabericola_migrator_1__9157@NODE_48_length_16467_cov_53_390427_g44_i0_p3_GENE_NODE_48_length_16467_cov_53_390427_g44_i0NODE_48_length_16467_cov_53_390427_g44_i0_p3_ORF_typecomplete_len396_score53_28Fumble/PF03630_14/1_8e83Fumble/PF03630_14/0_0067AP_endonuc_2_N/PF07582_12/0_053_NODE_48_length_16467_cov_53_390427_g44_i081619348